MADPTYVRIDNVVLSTIRNAGFETGGLDGWSSNGVTSAVALSGQPSAYGRYAAQVGSTNPSLTNTLSQSFDVPMFGVSTINVDYRITCPDTVQYDQTWITLKDNVTKTVYTLLANTCTNNGTWSTVSFGLAPVLGHNVTLMLHLHDDDYVADPSYAWFDNVRLN